MEDIIKIVKSLEGSGLLLKGVSETIQNETKEQKGGFLSMFLGKLGSSLLWNILAGKGAIVKRQNWRDKVEEQIELEMTLYERDMEIKIEQIFSVPPYPLTSFETQKYYGVYSRDNLGKIKDRAYVINLHEYSDIGTHWILLYASNNYVTYFDSFGVEHIPKEKIIGNKT